MDRMRLHLFLCVLAMAAPGCSTREVSRASGLAEQDAPVMTTASPATVAAETTAPTSGVCAQDADCISPQRCLASSTGRMLCAAVCDPLESPGEGAASTCSSGRACAGFFSVLGTVVAGCVKSGTKRENEPCTMTPTTSDHDCASGLYCLSATSGSSGGKCARFCDAAHVCARPGQECMPLADSAGTPTGYAVCALPSPAKLTRRSGR
jgi:hypothetical protein